MLSSLSSLVDNLFEGLHNYNCDDCSSYLDYMKKTKKTNILIYKCTECSKNHKKYFNQDLIKRVGNTYEFSDRDNNKFVLLLKKRVYSGKLEVKLEL